MTTIAVAESQGLVREALIALLGTAPSLRVIGGAQDEWQTLELVARHKPRILLLSGLLPRHDTTSVLHQLREDRATRCIVLTHHTEPDIVIETLRAGAAGYVLVSRPSTELFDCIAMVAAGQIYASPAVSQRVFTTTLKGGRRTLDPAHPITPRERQVLELSAEGFDCPQIGSRLSISRRTVETHRANLMAKLSLKSQTDLVRYAIRHSIVAA